MRPANIITSVSDVLAGIAVSGFFFAHSFNANHIWPVLLLCISTSGLYGGEVHGGNKNLLYAASFLYILVISFIFYFAITNKVTIIFTVIFLLAFAWIIFNPLLKAIKQPIGKNIGKAVKAGVIGLILMNASWASAFNALY